MIVAAALHPADQGDTTTIEGTLTAAEKNLAQLGVAPTIDQPSELAADKGYHSRAVLKSLDGSVWKTRIAEPKQPGFSRWHGDDQARAAVYANRTRKGKKLSNEEWISKTDPEAKITKLKDGRTHLAYKPELRSISTPV